jgi:hypothetical protein
VVDARLQTEAARVFAIGGVSLETERAMEESAAPQ